MLVRFSKLLARLAKVSDRKKCISLKNVPCLARPTLINLNSNEIHYFPFIVSLDRCNTLDDLSSRLSVGSTGRE